MIVSQDDSCCVQRQGFFHYLTWIDAGAVDGAAKHFFELQNTVAVIEEQAAEHLVRQIPQPRGQKFLGIGRAANRLAGLQRLFVIASCEFRLLQADRRLFSDQLAIVGQADLRLVWRRR